MIEISSDRSGYSLPGSSDESSRAIREDRDLVEAAAVYKLLQHARAAIFELSGRLGRLEISPTSEAACEEKTEPLLDQMYEIAWKVASIPANTIEGANAKAQILLDWCEDKRENLIEALAASLCVDVQKVFCSGQDSIP